MPWCSWPGVRLERSSIRDILTYKVGVLEQGAELGVHSSTVPLLVALRKARMVRALNPRYLASILVHGGCSHHHLLLYEITALVL